MVKPVLEAIEQLVTVIYDVEQNTLHLHFQKLVEALSTFVTNMNEIGYTVLLDEEFIKIQKCYEKQDFVEMADVLLYELKPDLEGLLEQLNETL